MPQADRLRQDFLIATRENPASHDLMRPLYLCLSLSLSLAPVLLEAATPLPPYDQPPPAAPPYYRVRYDAPASPAPGELIFPVNYTVWVPPGIATLRGVIVHQHGCGEGSCKSGQTGAFDLHWQALAQKHACALLAPSYEQPDKAECQMWCDPRNGSGAAFQKALTDLGSQSGHPELATVPWALWGHSGGGHWAGGITLTHPERVAAVWLRSGVPLLEANPERATIKPHSIPAAALLVPILCNPGTKEGLTVKDGRFAGVWPSNEAFFKGMREKGALIGIAVDPLSAHECGNQRYLAIPWLDACLTARLPETPGASLRPMPTNDVWLAALPGSEAVPSSRFPGNPNTAIWLPNATIAKSWMHYVKDTAIPDLTPPPAPTGLQLNGSTLTWTAAADLESGIAHFLIERAGTVIGKVPESPKNPFGRPIFQGLQYSDTPTAPLVEMRFAVPDATGTSAADYRVRAVNTAGLTSRH